MVKLVDTRDLKSLGLWLCRFKPGSGYQRKTGGYRNTTASFAGFLYHQRITTQGRHERHPRTTGKRCSFVSGGILATVTPREREAGKRYAAP